MAEPPAAIEPLDPAQDDLFEIRAGKNCLGMATFEYAFLSKVDDALLAGLTTLGQATFPLGRATGVVKIEVPGWFRVEGILGLRRLRLLVWIGVEAWAARERFEPVLAKALACRGA